MACCLMAPSHYLNQCWLIINGIPRDTSRIVNIAGINEKILKKIQYNDILKGVSQLIIYDIPDFTKYLFGPMNHTPI